MTDRCRAGLPYTDRGHIDVLRKEYEDSVLGHGYGADEAEKCFNYVWALVHSRDKKDVRRGEELIEAMLSAEDANDRELNYLKAVGEFRLSHFLAARKTLKSTLELYPDFRQAESLLDSVESELVKDGLVGLGAGAVVVGAIAAIAALSSGRR